MAAPVSVPPPENVITILIGGILTVAPLFVTSLPLPYRAGATGIIALLVQVFHLYKDPPT